MLQPKATEGKGLAICHDKEEEEGYGRKVEDVKKIELRDRAESAEAGRRSQAGGNHQQLQLRLLRGKTEGDEEGQADGDGR